MRQCEMCGCWESFYNPIEKHHVFHGRGIRKLAEKYGMTIHICHNCHQGPEGVHNNRELDLSLKRQYQERFEEEGHSREEFRTIFGKSYL